MITLAKLSNVDSGSTGSFAGFANLNRTGFGAFTLGSQQVVNVKTTV
jgi:hypothetical protein